MTNIIIPNLNAQFIGTYNEYGYREVLDSFKSAEFIMISSYNIDEHILQTLKNCNPDANVNIVTNVPNRFDSYYSESARMRYKKSLEKYMESLDPSNFHSQSMEVWFSFHNHSKIIMTDKVVYVGSQNFSIRSRDNYEAGLIINDLNAIREIKESFLNLIIDQSINYRAPDVLINLAQDINETSEEFNRTLDLLHESLYSLYDDYPVFGDGIWYLSLFDRPTSLNEISVCIENIKEYTDNIIQEIENLKEEFSNVSMSVSNYVYKIFDSIIDSLNIQKDEIDDIFSNLEDLEYFNEHEEEMAMEIFQDKYGLEAHDEESTQYYLDHAMSQAHEIFSEYVNDAEKELRKIEECIISNSKKFTESKTSIIDFSKRILDNT